MNRKTFLQSIAASVAAFVGFKKVKGEGMKPAGNITHLGSGKFRMDCGNGTTVTGTMTEVKGEDLVLAYKQQKGRKNLK